ncbi:MAG: apolipoprotein N-acyltransferase [Pseudomonadota bacterium]
MSIWQARVIWAALGLVLSLIHEPFGLWPLAFGGLFAVFWISGSGGLGLKPFGQGWWLGLGYFAGTFNWIVSPFFVKPEVHGWLMPFGLGGMAGGLALFWGVAFVLAGKLRGRMNHAVALGLSLAALELARSEVLTGLPWGMFAQAFVYTGFGQALAVIGPHGLGLLIISIAVLPFVMNRRWIGGALALVVFFGVEVWGQLRLSQDTVLTDLNVRLLQTNNPQDKKWQPEWREVYFADNLDLSRSAGDPDVVIWPENAVTWALNDIPTRRVDIAMAAGNKPVLVGGYHYVEQSYYNALARLGPVGQIEHLYNKYHLVPFGEYVPGVRLWERLGLAGLLPPYWTPGVRPDVVYSDALPPYLPQICYESIFTRYGFAASGRPEWIVLVTNDAWFGAFSGPQQHLAQARMRAIEQGLPVARVANTGISAMIDGHGRVLASLPMNVRDVLDHDLPKSLQPTVYSAWRQWPAVLLGLLLLTLGLFTKRQDPLV